MHRVHASRLVATAFCLGLLLALLSQCAEAYSISGSVKNGEGAALVGVTVKLFQGDSLSSTVSTNAEGRYAFYELAAGTYSVRPNREATAFDPVSRSVTLPPNTDGANFVARPAGSIVSGTVKTPAGAALAGVGVTLYQGDATRATTATNAEGRYTFSNVAAGSYSVRPAREATTFDPVSRSLTVPPGTDSASFVATPSGSVISGTVKNGEGAALAGVSVTLYQGDAVKAVTSTNTNGRYTFSNVPAGSYAVKPSRESTLFDPVSRGVTVPPSTDGANFVARPATSVISGTARSGSGAALSGIAVRLYQGDTLRASTTTNLEGRYTFPGLAAGTYTVRPARETLLFDPISRAVTVPPSTDGANFVARPVGSTISGVIKNAQGAPMAEVTVTLWQADVARATAVTNAEGRYTFARLAEGLYVVRPFRRDVTFTPLSRAVTVPPSNLTVNFVGGAKTFRIGGLITDGTSGLANVAVTIRRSGQTVMTVRTNAEGRYAALALEAGTYTVTPVKEGYRMDPSSRTVTVPLSAAECSFLAVEL